MAASMGPFWSLAVEEMGRMAWREVVEVATRDFKTGTKRVADMMW